jgi:hypothetical protein
MYYDDYYGISNPQPPPWWMLWLPFLRRLCENPLFQLRIKNAPKVRQIGGVGLALLILLFILPIIGVLIHRSDEGKIDFSTVILWYTPIFLAASGITGIRMFLECIVAAPISFAREIQSRRLKNIRVVPLSDYDLFYGSAWPSLYRVLKINQNSLAILSLFYLGLTIVSLANLNGLEEFELSFGLSTIPAKVALYYLFIPLLFVQLLVYLMLIANASGLYTLNMPPIGGTVATMIHVSVVFLFTQLLSAALEAVTFKARAGWSMTGNIFFFVSFQTLFTAFLAWLTGEMGVIRLARWRRPGFYEDEWASAAGMGG